MMKHVQKQFYSLIRTKAGLAIVLVGLFWSFNTIVALLTLTGSGPEVISMSPASPLDPALSITQRPMCTSNFFDNLAGRSFEHRMALPPVDVVYTWVNGSDPQLIAELARWKALEAEKRGGASDGDGDGTVSSDSGGGDGDSDGDGDGDTEMATANRYRDNHELRYSMRSIFKYAPWVRRIFLVTNGQVPRWLNTDHPRITVVPHSAIFQDPAHLPCFSSPAIEANLHNIPGLSEKFIYFNDDVMLGREVWPEDFWSPHHGQNVFLSWNIPDCAPGCPGSWISDRYCDAVCNNAACNFDGGDCKNTPPAAAANTNNNNNNNNNNGGTSLQQQIEQHSSQQTSNQYCSPGCPNNWIGDKVCDRSCKVLDCAFDAGDCGFDQIRESLFQVLPLPETKEVELPPGTSAFFVNLTQALPGKLSAASHDNPKLVRTAVGSQASHVVSFVLNVDQIQAGAREEGQGAGEADNGPQDGKVYGDSVEVFMETTLAGEKHSVRFNVLTVVEEADAGASSSNVNAGTNTDVEEDPYESMAATLSHHIGRRLLAEDARTEQAREGGGQSMTGIPVVWSHEGTEGEGNEKIGKEKEVKVGVWEEYETALLALLEKRIEQQDSRHNENGETNEHGDSNKGNDNTRQFVGDILKNIWPWELNVSFPLTKLPSSSSFSDSFLDRVHDLADQYDMALSPSSVASDNNLDASGEAKDNDSEPVHRQSRRLLIDAFGASLLHVNALLDQQLGSVSNTRRVPAHMPHFLDKTILQEIHDIWPEQFRATSSHRFRDPTDMQFSFTYFYYLMQATRSFDMDDFFRERLDNDGDGELGWTEVEYLLMLTEKGETPSASKVDQLYKGLVAVSKQQGKGGRIEPSTLSFDPLVHKAVEAVAGKRPKYKHQLQNLDEVEFYMVPANSSKITQHMNHVRYKRSKFICLNDNMDGKDPKATNHAQEALRSFFEAYYPLPSPLELQEHAPDNYIRHLGRDSTYAYTQAPHSPTYATWLLLLLILALVVGIGGWGALTRNNRESPLSSCAALPSLQL